MSLTNQVYKDFNKYMKTFVKELNTTFPDLSITKYISTSFYLLKKLNKKLPHKVFNKYIAKSYESKLLERDEQYFLDPGFSISYWGNMIQQVKDIWVTLDDHNKKMVWDHVVVLVALNRKCVEYRNRNKAEDSGDEAI